jgi:hypothetical protein
VADSEAGLDFFVVSRIAGLAKENPPACGQGTFTDDIDIDGVDGVRGGIRSEYSRASVESNSMEHEDSHSHEKYPFIGPMKRVSLYRGSRTK